MAEDWQAGGFGLYIHWPFCAAKCPYCDFNSHVTAEIDHTRWRDAYLSEIRRIAALTPGRILTSVFFGGGTPSLMAPDTTAAVIQTIRQAWPMVNDPEITLEANPTSVEAGRFRAFRDAGITRISMGIQSLRDDHLRALGRLHTVAEARAAFDIARRAFDRVSFDLIYARQNQSLPDWHAELTEALAMAADHLSLYQLTVEPGTAFGARYAKGGLRGLPDEDLAADLYDLTQDLCDHAGLPAYEISNHAAPGSESRHNLIYWRAGDYAGIGPGAHGRLTLNGQRLATETPRSPTAWLERVEQTGSGEQPPTPLSLPDQADEYLMMSLRLNDGTDLARHRRLGGKISMDTIDILKELGLATIQNNHLIAQPAGRIVLNAVLRQLMAG
ncbi:MAG: radical SAM family heme chaperone HemW [Qingshengfaniella sp.]